MEIFQWHDNLPAEAYDEEPAIQNDVADELADVLIYCLSMANEFDINLEAAVKQKLESNEHRFNAEQSKQIREELETWQVDR